MRPVTSHPSPTSTIVIERPSPILYAHIITELQSVYKITEQSTHGAVDLRVEYNLEFTVHCTMVVRQSNVTFCNNLKKTFQGYTQKNCL